MKEQFVTYEIALALKELGFDWPCLAVFAEDNSFKISMFGQRFYTIIETSEDFTEDIEINDVLAPLWSQIIDWFRDVHNIDICLVAMGDEWNEYNLRQVEPFKVLSRAFAYETYHEAREKAILRAIELIKNKL